MALLLGNSSESAIEIAQQQPPVGSVVAMGNGHLSSNSTARPSHTRRRMPFTFWLYIRMKSQARRLVPIASDAALQSRGRGCPGRDRRPGTRRGSMHEHSVAAAGFLFREVDRIRSSYTPNVLGKIPPGVTPESEWHRCSLDYSEAQPFEGAPSLPLPAPDRGRASSRPRRVVADFGIGSSNPPARPLGSRTY